MTANGMNPKVDFYFIKAKKWQEELKQLRMIALDCGLMEELKWGCPCYTFPVQSKAGVTKTSGTSKPARISETQTANIVLIHAFKEYCAFLFFKGALLQDTNKLLIRQTENVQSARQIRFTGAGEITRNAKILKAYIFQAIEVEKAGLKVHLKDSSDLTIPEELKNKMKEMPALKKAFSALTPGRQRGYLLYFSAAKQASTRESRIEKYIKPILSGKGLND